MNGGDDDGVEKNVLAFGDRWCPRRLGMQKYTHTV